VVDPRRKKNSRNGGNFLKLNPQSGGGCLKLVRAEKKKNLTSRGKEKALPPPKLGGVSLVQDFEDKKKGKAGQGLFQPESKICKKRTDGI